MLESQEMPESKILKFALLGVMSYLIFYTIARLVTCPEPVSNIMNPCGFFSKTVEMWNR